MNSNLLFSPLKIKLSGMGVESQEKLLKLKHEFSSYSRNERFRVVGLCPHKWGQEIIRLGEKL